MHIFTVLWTVALLFHGHKLLDYKNSKEKPQQQRCMAVSNTIQQGAPHKQSTNQTVSMFDVSTLLIATWYL